jgi:hypothetical protein
LEKLRPEKLTFGRVNLLREGLDLPEVSLVAMLDADGRIFAERLLLSKPSAGGSECFRTSYFIRRPDYGFNEAGD